VRGCGRGEQARAEDEAADVLHRKTGTCDCLEGIAACVAATADTRPQNVERALMKAPEDRWPTAASMREALLSRRLGVSGR